MAALVGLLLLPITSSAALLTIGRVAPANPGAICGNGEFEVLAGGTGGSTYRTPAPGVITSWSTSAAEGSGQELGFKVYRPLAGGNFLVVGHDGPRPLTPSVLNTFAVSIPVQAGDLIGNNDENADAVANACDFNTGDVGDSIIYSEGNFPDGATFAEEGTNAEVLPNVSATLFPAPTISSISPASGSITGGTSVVIAGSNFAEVRSVSFGGVAASFAVNSEGQITATAPPSASVTSVPVSVATFGGAATASQPFAYEGCTVPNLRHRKLKAAKKALRRKSCRIGSVKKLGDATAKTGRVVKQQPKAGQILPPGSKVSVKLHD
jgi:IPT/TIG domain-containing protein/PASTA domain-containing protein